ncbi:MAG: hypothetical protein ACYDDU_06820 [Dermatophilaceae bacterium]|jgi:hypothetical protein
MTDHPTHSPATSDTTGEDTTCEDTVAQACVHIDAAARQLEASADGDAFSPLLGLAGQLALIRGGIDPTIRAAVDPEDLLGPMAHTDQALSLLDSVPPSAGPTDLLVWTLRLADLHEALVAAGSEQP